MNRYYVHNRTRRTWCFIACEEFLSVGQVVWIHFVNEDIEELCECEILEVMRGLDS